MKDADELLAARVNHLEAERAVLRNLLADLWAYATGDPWPMTADEAAAEGDALAELRARMSEVCGRGVGDDG
jgi:hypothetical protein